MAEKYTEEQKHQIKLAGYNNPLWFISYFLQSSYPLEFPFYLRALIALMTKRPTILQGDNEYDKIQDCFRLYDTDGKKTDGSIFLGDKDNMRVVYNPNLMIQIPRGFGKTAALAASILWATLYKEHPFIVIISKTSTHARDSILGYIRAELESNDEIKAVFGNLKPERLDREKWTDMELQTVDGVSLYATGKGGQVRGIKRGNTRPTLIVVDDPEDSESVATPEQREKLRLWFFGDLSPCIDPFKESRIFVVGTLTHEDSLLEYIIKDDEYNNVKMSCVYKGESIWPEHTTLEKLEKKKQTAIRQGQYASFLREYYSIHIDEEHAIFRKKDFRYESGVRERCIALSIACDPAVGKTRSSDFCVFAVCGITDKGELAVIDIYGDKGIPGSEQIDKYFELRSKWNTALHGWEGVAYQSVMFDFFTHEMARRNDFFEITPIKHSEQKKMRIRAALEPRFKSGSVIFREKVSIT